MKHLLNCRQCDWHTVVEGPSMVADGERESHGGSIRNWSTDESELCDLEAIAWAIIREISENE